MSGGAQLAASGSTATIWLAGAEDDKDDKDDDHHHHDHKPSEPLIGTQERTSDANKRQHDLHQETNLQVSGGWDDMTTTTTSSVIAPDSCNGHEHHEENNNKDLQAITPQSKANAISPISGHEVPPTFIINIIQPERPSDNKDEPETRTNMSRCSCSCSCSCCCCSSCSCGLGDDVTSSPTRPSPGNWKVTIDRQQDDWNATDGHDLDWRQQHQHQQRQHQQQQQQQASAAHENDGALLRPRPRSSSLFSFHGETDKHELDRKRQHHHDYGRQPDAQTKVRSQADCLRHELAARSGETSSIDRVRLSGVVDDHEPSWPTWQQQQQRRRSSSQRLDATSGASGKLAAAERPHLSPLAAASALLLGQAEQPHHEQRKSKARHLSLSFAPAASSGPSSSGASLSSYNNWRQRQPMMTTNSSSSHIQIDTSECLWSATATATTRTRTRSVSKQAAELIATGPQDQKLHKSDRAPIGRRIQLGRRVRATSRRLLEALAGCIKLVQRKLVDGLLLLCMLLD